MWAVALAALIWGVLSLPAAAEAGRPGEQPNIVVVTTDDQHAASMNSRVMPNVARLVAGRGARFERAIAATPLCCPSRATFLTGQYGHNHGILWSRPGYAFLRDPSNTLPVWLQAAGYRTVHVGKYLNGFEAVTVDPAAPLLGWEQWHTVVGPVRYYDYVLGVNGRRLQFGVGRRDYLTGVLNRRAERLIRRYGPGRRPLFMVVDQFAPHSSPGPEHVKRCSSPGPEPAWRDRARFSRRGLPRPPSFAESDVSDKPSFIQRRDLPAPDLLEERTRWYRCALGALRAVDRGVRGIWRALGAIGERRDTVLLFTSDHGFYYGEHRLFAGADKTVPYRESLEVPLAVRLPPRLRPPAARGLRIGGLVANVDLAPTLLALADAEPCVGRGRCRTLDGRSLLPLLRGRERAWARGRAIPIELDVGTARAGANLSCRYQGLWTRRRAYVRHTAATTEEKLCGPIDEAEHYDLREDPHQLRNLYPSALGLAEAEIENRLAGRARRLAACSGIRGRDPALPGRSHCE